MIKYLLPIYICKSEFNLIDLNEYKSSLEIGLKLFLQIFIVLPAIVFCQLSINLPDNFKVLIDDTPQKFSRNWFDSLQVCAEENIFLYAIDGSVSGNRKKITSLHLPQTLTTRQIIIQVILYYSLIDNDEERQREKIYIYPYFVSTDDQPYIECEYTDNEFNFLRHRWERIKVPQEPTLEEKVIYNELMEEVLQSTISFGELNNEDFETFSITHDISLEEVKRIYKKVVLWQSKL